MQLRVIALENFAIETKDRLTRIESEWIPLQQRRIFIESCTQ